MPIYRYRVRDKTGKVSEGTLEGSDPTSVLERLDALGYIPITLKEEKARAAPTVSFGQIFAPRVKDIHLINFTRQFVALHRAGLPMLTTIGTLQTQTRNRSLARALDAVRKDLMGGASLSQALSRHPRIFSELYVNSVWAGETGGVLDEILTRLADLLDHERRLKSDVRGALRYPIFLMVAFVIAVIVLVTFVLPRFITLLTGLETDVPTPTRILIAVTTFSQRFWFLGLLIFFILGLLFYLFTRTRGGRLWWDRVKLKIPICGKIIFDMTMSRFARLFETLDRTGLPILRSLSLVAKATGNAYVATHIDNIAESVRKGRGIATPMRESGIFPPMVVQMVATGEESGALDEMLRQVSDYYDREVEYAVKNLTGMIEPVLILIMGVAVFFLIIAVIMPYMAILTSLGARGF